MRQWTALAGMVFGLLVAAGCSSPQSASLTPSDPASNRTTLDVTAVPLVVATPISASAIPISASAIPISASAFPISASAFPISASAFPISASAFPIDTRCTIVTDTRGNRFSAAQVGGGDHIAIDWLSERCDVGIYIGPDQHGPAKLDHAVVEGPFNIGVYFDNAGKATLDHTSICANGANPNGTCAAGVNHPGIGLGAWKTPDLKVNHTNIGGYAVDQGNA